MALPGTWPGTSRARVAVWLVTPRVLIVPKRKSIPPDVVSYMFDQRHLIISEKLAVTAMDPVRLHPSCYYVSFSCDVPGDSVETRSKVLSVLITGAREQAKVIKAFAKAFTPALPKRADDVRVEEVLMSWDVRHMKVNNDDVWQLMGMPFVKPGDMATHYKMRKDLATMFAGISWERYTLAFEVLVRHIPLRDGPIRCSGCGDSYHASHACTIVGSEGYNGPRSLNAVHSLIPTAMSAGQPAQGGGFGSRGRGGFGFRGRGGPNRRGFRGF
ncbi:hypothetical protein HDZ31DRAFT_74372 [Schizophyllum fasciatum]